MEKKIKIAGMTCSNCENTIKQALLKHDSIHSVSVSYKTGIVYLKGSKSISNSEINDIIEPFGYQLDKESFPWSYLLTLSIGISLSYTISGLILGFVGSIFQISNEFKNILLLSAGVWLIVLSLQMANIIQLPELKWNKYVKSSHSFTIGLLNGLMPCGALQTMQIVALSSGSPVTGAMSMFVFGLVTSPALFGMQWLGFRLTQVKAKTIKLVSSMIVLLLGLQMVIQSPIIQNNIDHIFRHVTQAPIVNGIQKVKLSIVEGRYVLDYNTVEAGIPVELSFDHTQFLGCANPIILSFLNNQSIDVLKNPEPVTFIPTQEELRIHCWMDMDNITLYVKKL